MVSKKLSTELLNAGSNNLSIERVAYLIENGADPNFVSKQSRTTPLLNAISNSNFALVEFLLKNGANPNLITSHIRCPLSQCLSLIDKDEPYMNMVELLLKYGANPNHGYIFHEVLEFVKYFPSEDIIRLFTLLIDHGGDINLPNEDGIPVLFEVVHQNLFEVMPFLLERCDTHYQHPEDGETVFHIAVKRGHNNMLELLLSNPRDRICIGYINQKGKSALDLARSSNNTVAVEMLERHMQE